MASEIVARVTDEVFDSLKAAPVRSLRRTADAVAGRSSEPCCPRWTSSPRSIASSAGSRSVKTGQLSTRNDGGGLQSVIKSFALVEALVDAARRTRRRSPRS
jgi:hypothetical protein